jgi:hypothetical protein
MLRALIGGALLAFAFAPTASAETGAPVTVSVDAPAAGASVPAAVTATPTVDVSAPVASAPAASVDASAAASTPAASAAASAVVPATPTSPPAPRAEATAAVGSRPAVSARVDAAGAPTASARVDAAPASPVQVSTRPERAEEPATPRLAPPVAQAPLGLERAAGTSSTGAFSLVLRRPESSLPLIHEESAISAVADAPPAGPPAAARGSKAPVRIGSDSAGRRRLSEPAPAPFFHLPGPLGPPGGSAAGAAAAWLILFVALAAAIALAPPVLKRRLRLRRIPIRSCSYCLLLERPG